MHRENKPQNALDYSLRNLYISLRNIGAQIMAIEFEHRGKKWRCDTVEEAVSLRRNLEINDAQLGRDEHEQHVWTPDLLMEFFDGLGPLQKQFLVEVHGTHRINSWTLVKKLKLESEIALAGVLSGLSKRLKKMSMIPSDVYRVDVSWEDKTTKERAFTLAPDFLFSASELGWPEVWEQKGKDASSTKTERK
jgi:hypothetical protein